MPRLDDFNPDEWGNQNLPGWDLTSPTLNHKIANKGQSDNPKWRKAQAAGIRKKTQTEEWKEHQLQGIHNIRANNPEWQKNVKAGARKREDDPEFKKVRKAINGAQASNPKWIEGIKNGMKDRWNKEENLSTCPHCNKTTDNANYKRWHGDNCKNKS